MWRYVPVTPVLRRQRQEGYCEFEAMQQVPGQPATKLKPFLFMIKHKQELMKTIAVLHMIFRLR